MHLACEQRRKPLATVLTGGQAADSPQFTTVLGRIRVPRRCGPGRPRTRPERVLGNKTYSSRANRTHLRRRGIPATILVKADQRGFATPYDKLAVRYDATVQVTNINIWLRDSSNRA